MGDAAARSSRESGLHINPVNFMPPKDVSAEDMKNYILQVGASLGVNVDSFRWATGVPKISPPPE